MIRTQRPIVLVCSAFLLACGSGEPPADAVPPAPTTAPAAEESPLAAMAGTWSVRATNAATGDSVASYELTATADRNGWTLTFPGRDPLPVHIAEAAGDSVVAHVGPYESVVRPGVQVTTETVNRIQGDRLVGSFVARYANAGADSVLIGRIEGTRIR